MRDLEDLRRARRLSRELESRAALLGFDDVRELFRRVGASEIKTGDFLRRFGEALSSADIENFAIMLPAAYKLLAKYPYLVELHRATPVVKEFPPPE